MGMLSFMKTYLKIPQLTSLSVQPLRSGDGSDNTGVVRRIPVVCCRIRQHGITFQAFQFFNRFPHNGRDYSTSCSTFLLLENKSALFF